MVERGIGQGHGYRECPPKELAFYPKSKLLPIAQVVQYCVG